MPCSTLPDLQESALAVAARRSIPTAGQTPGVSNYLVDQVKLPEGSDGASIVCVEIFYRDTLRD